MFSYLQPVVPPVGMEVYVLVHLPLLTVSVAVGTQDPIAREQVATATAQLRVLTYMHSHCAMKHWPMCFIRICSL